MLRRKPVLGVLVVLATATVAVALASAAHADVPGPDDLLVGPGATLTVQPAEDNVGGAVEKFGFGIKARTSDRSLLMGLFGPAISVCSIHGPSAQVDFNTEDGNLPLQQMQCGRAFGMDVTLDGCEAQLEYHGFVHSDRSTRIYFGPMTADVTFEKTGVNTGSMRVTIFTPKAPIVLKGDVQSPTPIVMTTCP